MPKFCTNCGKPMEFENAEICPRCGVRLRPPAGATAENRSALIAVLLSFFFVGWGHWYNGRRRDGLILLGAFLTPWLLIPVLSTPLQDISGTINATGMLIFIAAGIWIFGMYDAYRVTRQINRGELGFSRKSRLFWIPAILIPLMVIVVAAIAALYIVSLQAPEYTPISYSPGYPYRPVPTPIQIPFSPIRVPIRVPTIYPIPTIIPVRVPTVYPIHVPTVAPYRPVYPAPIPAVTPFRPMF